MFDDGLDVPLLAPPIVKNHEVTLPKDKWSKSFDETIVHVERVIAYWSRILKPAERNYSPTEREALALKESLIKFQPYIEGEKLVAITDHAALTWSKTYQNINRRLLTWGTVFAAYPEMAVVHRAGRVHSNVDPISRLRRRTPIQEGPVIDDSKSLALDSENDPLNALYENLSPGYEERVLNLMKDLSDSKVKPESVFGAEVSITPELTVNVQMAEAMETTVAMDESELESFKTGYEKDTHFSLVLNDLSSESNWRNPKRPQYYAEDGLVYFTDWEERSRLCVPKSKQKEIMEEIHESISLAAHQGFAKTYNRIASLYYWPRMSRDIKTFVNTCDICQRMKARRHAPYGYLKSIPIPSQPFETVSMDFIAELPVSDGKDAVLVIVDKLTKYALFVPTKTKVGEVETAQLFFENVWKYFGIPIQIISDRDARWSNAFWKELTRLVGSRRALTTAHHPQADGQTEIMNQTLEVGLRTYVNATKDDWASKLTPFQHAYNSSVHTSTGKSPAYLLCGFQPLEPENLLSRTNPIAIERRISESKDAELFAADMEALRREALDALKIAQVHQQRAYNKGRLDIEFEIGDKVLLNPHSMKMARDLKGLGKKLIPKYDGPFEVLDKISPITYRLRLPASYKIHPVISIAHLQPYRESPPELGERTTRSLNRLDFEDLPEYEVERIVGEFYEDVRTKKAGKAGRRVQRFVTRFIGYGPEWDDYLTRADLRNAPDVLKEWDERDKSLDKEKGYVFTDPRKTTREVSQPKAESAPVAPSTQPVHHEVSPPPGPKSIVSTSPSHPKRKLRSQQIQN